MRHTRRDFLKTGAAAAGAMAVGLQACAKADKAPAADASAAADTPPAPLKILVLGGTGFIGPHMVRRAQERGHTITLFNRGKSNDDLFPDLETLIGDRDGKLDALKGRQWDAVIDTSGYVPRHVRDSAELLKTAAKHYLFISSISAYANFDQPGTTEDAPGGTLKDPTVEDITEETYGPLKVLCEKAVQAAFPTGAIVVRPGYIVGPGDSTDRWTYWPVRVAAGGEMLAPGQAADPIQVIDARDLAQFVIHLIERQTTGVFNAVGPAKPILMGEMLDRLKAATSSNATFTWVDAAWLDGQKASFPIWNAQTGPYAQVHTVSNARSVAAGLTYRSLEETARDTLTWWNGLPEERRNGMRSGLRQQPGLATPTAALSAQMEAEAKLLAAWKARK
ncbi:MAG: NAD-dependent epimerase/dehydratase family protein [Gemmatimonadales bacterium]|nr:NAD-dependent epimerase/dehydratase family protein [Gemmatimonadales bacterium]